MEIQTKGKQTRARASERYQMKDFAIRLSFIFFLLFSNYNYQNGIRNLVPCLGELCVSYCQLRLPIQWCLLALFAFMARCAQKRNEFLFSGLSFCLVYILSKWMNSLMKITFA